MLVSQPVNLPVPVPAPVLVVATLPADAPPAGDSVIAETDPHPGVGRHGYRLRAGEDHLVHMYIAEIVDGPHVEVFLAATRAAFLARTQRPPLRLVPPDAGP